MEIIDVTEYQINNEIKYVYMSKFKEQNVRRNVADTNDRNGNTTYVNKRSNETRRLEIFSRRRKYMLPFSLYKVYSLQNGSIIVKFPFSNLSQR